MVLKRPFQQRQVDPSVFRAYDIRGIVGEQLDENAVYSIGLAVAHRMKTLERDSLFIARDGRLSSEFFAAALAEGLLQGGLNVVDLGAVATPVMYYATHAGSMDSGLMITGSHNPADYNGIKLVLAGKTSVQADMTLLSELVNTKPAVSSTRGVYKTQDILPEYIQRIVSDIHLARPLTVVVDAGNGIAGPTIVKVLTALGCQVIPLFCEVDGRFPNHHPDPSVEANLMDVKNAVAAHPADIGLAFDGDADRLGVVTNAGDVIWPDRLMMLYAQDVLKRNPHATIVYDVKCSSHLAGVIEAAGGTPYMCPTGHSIVKGLMKELQAALAGEMSGHLFFKDRWYGFDDALYSACRLLEIISQSTASVSEQFSRIPNSVNTPEIKIPMKDDIKFKFMQQFSQQAQFPGAKCITIDGLRVEFPQGWGLLRASNTTPCLVARFEAEDEDSLHRIQQVFKTQLQAIDNALVIPF